MTDVAHRSEAAPPIGAAPPVETGDAAPPPGGRRRRRGPIIAGVAGATAATVAVVVIAGGALAPKGKEHPDPSMAKEPGTSAGPAPPEVVAKGPSLTIGDICGQVVDNSSFRESVAGILGVPAAAVNRQRCTSDQDATGSTSGAWNSGDGASKLTISVSPRNHPQVGDLWALRDHTYDTLVPGTNDVYYNDALGGTQVVGPDTIISVSYLQFAPGQNTNSNPDVTAHPNAQTVTVGLAQTLAGRAPAA